VATAPSRDVPVTTSEASLLFAHGVAALRAGRYAEADQTWQEFLAKHPGDPRAEDATFLRAVGRERSGDRHGAALLARTYLERFPQGMRRHEAETLSRDAP
jgi:TolA-binding protein